MHMREHIVVVACQHCTLPTRRAHGDVLAARMPRHAWPCNAPRTVRVRHRACLLTLHLVAVLASNGIIPCSAVMVVGVCQSTTCVLACRGRCPEGRALASVKTTLRFWSTSGVAKAAF